MSAIVNEKIEIRERCKGVHCVDLGESFPTSIYSQTLASIQPRTSPVKFAEAGREHLVQGVPCPPIRDSKRAAALGEPNMSQIVASMLAKSGPFSGCIGTDF